MAGIEVKQDTRDSVRRPAVSVRNILFATDFSATSESALPYAAAIARHFSSTLHLAHVLSDTNLFLMTGAVDYVSVGKLVEEAQLEAQQKLEHIKACLGNIPCCIYVRHGQIWTNLSEIVAAEKIDLIVVGTHGRTGLGKLVLGSVAEDILRHAPCPVLTVGPKIHGHARLPKFHDSKLEIAPPELELEQIVCATNLTLASRKLAPAAITLAEEFESQLTLLHVIEEYSRVGDRPGLIESRNRQLRALVPNDANLAYAPETVVQFGSAWECIVKTADEREADLIVLGAHPGEGTSHIPWSTVPRVVAHANCPVLTVRG